MPLNLKMQLYDITVLGGFIIGIGLAMSLQRYVAVYRRYNGH
jgi:hypothetical protein